MTRNNRSEKGQALLLIALTLAVLYGLVGFALDSGMAFSDRRQSQNAADAASLYAARIYAENLSSPTGASQDQVRTQVKLNGYGHDGLDTIVSLQVNPALKECPDEENGLNFTVTIESTVKTAFSQVIGISRMKNVTSATARGCKSHWAPPFYGNAVVALNPDPNAFSFDGWGTSNWTIRGGGIFSNAKAIGKGTNVVFPDGDCVTSVGSASGFPCPPNQNDTGQKINYPAGVAKFMPPDPCDGTPGDVGLPVPVSPGKGNDAHFDNGVYCVNDLDSFSGVNIILNNATLYITDPVFDLKFAGKGGFSGTAIKAGDFQNYFIVVPLRDPPCPSFTSVNSQVIEFRGNGYGDITGSVMAPSTCIDYRGNSNGKNVNSQIVGYNVTSNGSANVSVNYHSDDGHEYAALPTLNLIR